MDSIKKYWVAYTTRTNGNYQFAYVEAENKGEVKQKLREKNGEQIYIHIIDKCDS
jgi:phosphoglucomutase